VKTNVTYSLGNLALIEKCDDYLGGFLNKVFGGIEGRTKDFIPSIKLFLYNILGSSLAVSRLTDYPLELYHAVEFEHVPRERNLFRVPERIGRGFPIVHEKFQSVLREYGLVTKKQFTDFSSTYFEGKKAALGELGYSRDNLPGNKQVVFGINVGFNNIPSALTIQKGNVPDKKHFRFMLKAAEAVMLKKSIMIFDCGANTKDNKAAIREKGFHYLTLKPKKLGSPYKTAIQLYWKSHKAFFELNGREYTCVKRTTDDETEYIYFCEKLEVDQYLLKQTKFLRKLEKNEPILKRTKKGKPIGEYISKEGMIIAKGSLQTTIDGEQQNPYLNGLEGFFILQSSLDADPKAILNLYKQRDKAEKLIRNMKEGTELHPIRHWNEWSIKGYIILVFLANFLASLTLYLAKNPIVKNLKLLKKYLMKLTVAVIYPPNGFRFHFVTNITEEIRSILGDYIDKYTDKSLNLRW